MASGKKTGKGSFWPVMVLKVLGDSIFRVGDDYNGKKCLSGNFFKELIEL